MRPTNQVINHRRAVAMPQMPQMATMPAQMPSMKLSTETQPVEEVQATNESDLQTFMAVLNQNPDPRQVKKNAFANNSDYLPIQYLESLMDEIFNGLWNLKHKGTQFAGNTVTCDVEIEAFFPTEGVWITRAGSGSAMVQIDAQTGMFKQKSIEKAYGSALSMSFKNACKRFGNLFGRNLNREDEVHQYYKEAYGNTSKIVNQ